VDSETSTSTVIDRAGIEVLIPHRQPFLFVDRITERSADGLMAEWDVPEDAFFFKGHYPSNPILPGVILNEFVFQSAAVFMSLPQCSDSAESSPPLGVPVLTRIDNARFKQIVRPGQTVRAEITLTERLGPACYMKAKVTSNGKNVLRLNFVVAMATPDESA
jgi:3-hydroxyacyl-[acyl-carrier-protein] dehydratase